MAMAQEGSVSIDRLRFFDMETLRLQDQAQEWESSVSSDSLVLKTIWRTSHTPFHVGSPHRQLLGQYHRSNLYLQSQYHTPQTQWKTQWWGGAHRAQGGALGVKRYGTALSLRHERLSPLTFLWKDAELPNSSGQLDFNLKIRYTFGSLAHSHSLWGGQLQAKMGYGWSHPPALDSGHTLQDSTHAAFLYLGFDRARSSMHYTGFIQGISAFSQLQGLRHQQNDTKRFAYFRFGLDFWQTQHSIAFSQWSFTMLGVWSLLRIHPTSHHSSGESLAPNRLYNSSLLSILAQSLYRKSYEVEGDLRLWMAGTRVEWTPRFQNRAWEPFARVLMIAPRFRTRLDIQEKSSSFIFSHTQKSQIQGELYALLANIQLGTTWNWNRHFGVHFEVQQWLPWVLSNDIKHVADDQKIQSIQTDESSPWQAGRDGLGGRLTFLYRIH